MCAPLCVRECVHCVLAHVCACVRACVCVYVCARVTYTTTACSFSLRNIKCCHNNTINTIVNKDCHLIDQNQYQ